MKGINAIKKFREKHGPAVKEVTDWVKYCNTSMSSIRKSLAAGSKTVPEITRDVHLPAADVLWFVNAMRKYGETAVAGEENGYKKYTLVDFQND